MNLELLALWVNAICGVIALLLVGFHMATGQRHGWIAKAAGVFGLLAAAGFAYRTFAV